jgi:hypothetical protein
MKIPSTTAYRSMQESQKTCLGRVAKSVSMIKHETESGAEKKQVVLPNSDRLLLAQTIKEERFSKKSGN